MQKIAPFLWFNNQAEEAVKFYTAVFKNSKTTGITRYGEGAPMPKGSVMTLGFLLEGQEFIALNGGPAFTFSPAISFVVACQTQEEIDYYWKKLSEGGAIEQCGWLKDKYGVSWQIVPILLSEMLKDADVAKSQRVMSALQNMIKIDIETLKYAYGQ